MPFNHIFRIGEKENLLYAWFSAMHTRVDIALVSKHNESQMLQIIKNMENRISEIEQLANCFDPKSQLAQFNAGKIAADELHDELQHILSLCNEWKEKTGGIFDVAYSDSINLSGFLKGYALDEVGKILERESINKALINMGNSSIMAKGNQPGNVKGWLVKNDNGEEFFLQNECLTTSGNHTSTRCHIVNPLTDSLIKGQRIVSVITDSGSEGEVLAKVKFITENN